MNKKENQYIKYFVPLLDCQVTFEVNSEELHVTFKDLLKFITGADAIPPLGFTHPLNIYFFDQDKEGTRLPYASTCALNLSLPRGHDNPESFEELMSNSLFNSYGFGKA